MHNNNKDKESIEEKWELVEKEDGHFSVDIPSVEFGDIAILFLPGTSWFNANNEVAIAETGWPLPRPGQEYVQYGLAQAGGGQADGGEGMADIQWLDAAEGDDDLASVSSATDSENEDLEDVGNVIPESSNNEVP